MFFLFLMLLSFTLLEGSSEITLIDIVSHQDAPCFLLHDSNDITSVYNLRAVNRWFLQHIDKGYGQNIVDYVVSNDLSEPIEQFAEKMPTSLKKYLVDALVKHCLNIVPFQFNTKDFNYYGVSDNIVKVYQFIDKCFQDKCFNKYVSITIEETDKIVDKYQDFLLELYIWFCEERFKPLSKKSFTICSTNFVFDDGKENIDISQIKVDNRKKNIYFFSCNNRDYCQKNLRNYWILDSQNISLFNDLKIYGANQEEVTQLCFPRNDTVKNIAIIFFKNLKHLDLSKLNNLKRVVINACDALTDLTLSSAIENLAISYASSLKTINFSHAHIKNLWLQKLPLLNNTGIKGFLTRHIQRLCLEGSNKIKPIGLFDSNSVPELTYLSLRYESCRHYQTTQNQLEIKNYKKLKSIDLSYNRYDDYYEEINIDGCFSISTIRIPSAFNQVIKIIKSNQKQILINNIDSGSTLRISRCPFVQEVCIRDKRFIHKNKHKNKHKNEQFSFQRENVSVVACPNLKYVTINGISNGISSNTNELDGLYTNEDGEDSNLLTANESENGNLLTYITSKKTFLMCVCGIALFWRYRNYLKKYLLPFKLFYRTSKTK